MYIIIQLFYIMTIFYAVVYGSYWDDIEYFSGFHQACKKLIIQTLEFVAKGCSGFHPMIVEYNKDPYGNSTYGMTKNMFGIMKDDLEELARLEPAIVKENPMIAIHLINIIL